MEQDFIAELESKVNALIENYTALKSEKEQLTSDIDTYKNKISELEGENDRLGKDLQSLKDSTGDQQQKLDTAAEKVKELIAKLEAVE